MIILNFSHELTDKQEESIRKLTNTSDEEWNKSKTYRVKCYINIEKNLDDQIDEILSNIPDMWTNNRILVVPPPIAHSAIMILLGIYSKCGFFPETIRIKKRKGSTPPEYVVAEIIALQEFKDRMRAKRQNQKIIVKNIGEN